MNIPTPAVVRTAHRDQMVREARTPVYTTETPKTAVREHYAVVEMQDDETGYRRRQSMPDNEVTDYIDSFVSYWSVSDIDHSTVCWCFDREV